MGCYLTNLNEVWAPEKLPWQSTSIIDGLTVAGQYPGELSWDCLHSGEVFPRQPKGVSTLHFLGVHYVLPLAIVSKKMIFF